MTVAAPPLVVERPTDAVSVLRLNRPERLNAVSPDMYAALDAALVGIAADRAVRAVVIIGTGRAFCVGADLKAHHSDRPTSDERRAYVVTGQRVNRALQTLAKPVIAAVNGHAIGAGMELALSCDIIIAAAEAKLRFPEVTLGTMVGGGTIYTLAQRVGVAKAKELILLGEFLLGSEAAAIGLVNTAVPAADVRTTALEVAERAASHAPTSMALAKDLLDRAQRLDFESALELEADALLRCMDTRDWQEGIDAFHQKRTPHFTGE